MARRRPGGCGSGAAAPRPCGRRGSRPPPAPSRPAPPSLLLPVPSSSLQALAMVWTVVVMVRSKREPRRDDGTGRPRNNRPVNKGWSDEREERSSPSPGHSLLTVQACRERAEEEEWREGGRQGAELCSEPGAEREGKRNAAQENR